MIGYSLAFVRNNSMANQALLGVRLGKLCIEHDISVLEVSKQFCVSRQAVYGWFLGSTTPKENRLSKIASMIQDLETRSH